jgi:peptidyl-prolyl cis-trans isomerase SurA
MALSRKLIEKKYKEFFLTVITSAWCLFYLGFFQGAFARELVDRIVAEVNDDIILHSELIIEIAPFKAKIIAEGYPPEKEMMLINKLQEEILNRMVDARLTDQEVKRHNITITEEEIDQAIIRLRNASGLSIADYKAVLDRQGITVEAYRERVRAQILRTKLVNIQVSSKIVITQEEIEACYIRENDKYCGKKEYHLKYIIMKTPWPGSEYQKQDVRNRMDAVHEELVAGESIEALVRQYSDTEYDVAGGYLGAFEEETLSEQVKAVVSRLNVGEFTEVIETDQGFQILLLDKIEITEEKSLEEVTPEIEKQLYDEVVDEKFKEWFEELRKNAHIRIMLI